MGTALTQHVHGIAADAAMEAVAHEFTRLERLWSVFDPQSEISELARCAGLHPMPVCTDTAAVLTQAKQLCVHTEGAFDVTAGPLIALWRIATLRGELPRRTDIAEARTLVRIDDLVIGDGLDHAFLRRRGQSLDLGGIGKGYAADRARELYAQHGVRHAVLDFGGHIVAVGCRSDGSPWKVGIQDPGASRGAWLGYLEADDTSVVTSGSYERPFEVAGQRLSHIIDPRTGRPGSDELTSVTVVMPSSTVADALATGFMVLGIERSLALLDSMPGVEAVFIDRRGTPTLTKGLVGRFHGAA
jgi:thiamine biosynthesis lipoprotein